MKLKGSKPLESGFLLNYCKLITLYYVNTLKNDKIHYNNFSINM